jgi:hypothetical protein
VAEVNMEQLLNCALCPNMCRCECPVLQTLGREAVAPAGKARLALNIKKKTWPGVKIFWRRWRIVLAAAAAARSAPFPS